MHMRSPEWDNFTPTQKRAATIALAMTALRPILTGAVAAKGQSLERAWTWQDTGITLAAMATDLEGNVVRPFNATTKLGAKLDPLSDKLAVSLQELTLARRKEHHPLLVGSNLARDIAVSGLRRHVSRQTNGEASIGAQKAGKINSAFRQATIVFATSPLGEKYPKVRSSLQLISALGTIASGVITARQLISQLPQKTTSEV